MSTIAPEDRKTFATLQEVADNCGCGTLTIRRRVADGTLPAYKLAKSRAVRIKWSDVDAMFNRIPTADLADLVAA